MGNSVLQESHKSRSGTCHTGTYLVCILFVVFAKLELALSIKYFNIQTRDLYELPTLHIPAYAIHLELECVKPQQKECCSVSRHGFGSACRGGDLHPSE
jgi:hypothetical protein